MAKCFFYRFKSKLQKYLKKNLLFYVLKCVGFMTDVLGKGKKNKVRVYYLAWLRNKILHNDPEVEKKQGWTTVGEMEGCVHYKVGE